MATFYKGSKSIIILLQIKDTKKYYNLMIINVLFRYNSCFKVFKIARIARPKKGF